MLSTKYQRKKAAPQSQINTPIDKSKKSLNITRTTAAPPSTLTTTMLIITETASDSKHRDHLEVKLAEQQQTDKLIKQVNQLERQVLILKSQLAVSETVNNLLREKADDPEAYCRRSCIHVNGLQKNDHENNDNLRETVVENISSKTGISKDNIRSIDKLHRKGKYD